MRQSLVQAGDGEWKRVQYNRDEDIWIDDDGNIVDDPRKAKCKPYLYERDNAIGLKEQLCWSCAKAYAACPWSIDFTPVEGWDAKETGPGKYHIYNCPLFVKG